MTTFYVRPNATDEWIQDPVPRTMKWWCVLLWRSNTEDPWMLSWHHHRAAVAPGVCQLFHTGYDTLAEMEKEWRETTLDISLALNKPEIWRLLIVQRFQPFSTDEEFVIDRFDIPVNDDPEYL
jgi:hypothetical protein